jgi:hypothetical protein
MEQQIVNEMVTAITPELWLLFLQMLATIVICLGLYQGLRNVVAYFFIRFDRELGKSVRVKIDGREGYIAHITMRHLIIKFDDENELLVPVTKVGQMTWHVIRPKNGLNRK